MALALLFAVFVLCCGYGPLRALGLLKGLTGLGLLAPTGMAVMAVCLTWLCAVPLPPPLRGIAVLVLAAFGVGCAVRDRGVLRQAARAMAQQHRGAAATFILALLIPVASMGFVFWGVEVPLSPHDGAFHTQVTHSLRAGSSFEGWYPPGVPSIMAGVLQLLPWVDTAQGTFGIGIGLAILAPLVVFGLGLAVGRNVAIATGAALFISLTFLYPYFPQIWSGWPLALSMLLTFGVWVACLEYLERPSWRWAALAGGLLGAILVVHGTELYTLALILLVVAATMWRRLPWSRLPAHLGIAAGLGVVFALPYLPALFHWAGGGGAFAVGYEDGRAIEDAASSFLANSTFSIFLADALGLDLPTRLVLVAVGVWGAARRGVALSVIGVGALFLAITVGFTLLNFVPIVRQAYAATFPWGMSYRTLVLVAAAQAVLSGAGWVTLRETASGWSRSLAARSPGAARRLGRLTRLLVIAWGSLVFWALVFTLSVTRVVVGFTPDDAAAMRWLRANAEPDKLVINDQSADAGIWIPYKTGLQIVVPRSEPNDGRAAERAEIMGSIPRLDQVAAAVCAMNVGYLYYGAAVSDWDSRRFPPLEELNASPALEQLFNSGNATVFRVRVPC
jgi:hypothetical protein